MSGEAFNPLWKELYQNLVQLFSTVPRGVPLPHSNALQYHVKREKCKVNDVIYPSGCEARTVNLGNKDMKIGIFTGGTSVRSKNIFTAISRYPTGKHEINMDITDYDHASSSFSSSSSSFLCIFLRLIRSITLNKYLCPSSMEVC